MTFDFKKPSKKKPKLNSRFKKGKKAKKDEENEDIVMTP